MKRTRRIRISISRPVSVADDGTETPYQDIEIQGSRSDLLALAEEIRRVAEAGEPGYHTHLWPDDPNSLVVSQEFGFTIELV